MEQDKEDNKEIAEIEDAIPANVNDILQELPEDKRNAILATMMSIEEERTFSGPLPPRSILKLTKRHCQEQPTAS